MPTKYLKAIAAFVTAGLGLLVQANADNAISTAEWRTVVIGAFVAAAAVWGIPNSPTTPPAP